MIGMQLLRFSNSFFFSGSATLLLYFANEYRARLFCIHDGKMNERNSWRKENRQWSDKDRINSMYGLRQRITALDGLSDIQHSAVYVIAKIQ